MAKNTSKVTKPRLSVATLKKPKVLGSAVVIIILIVAALLVGGRDDATTKVTSTRELAKSTVNTKNTEGTKVARATPTSPATPASTPSGSTSVNNTKKTPNTSAPSSGSSSGAGTSSGSGTPSSPPSPAVSFMIDYRPYTQVDQSSVDIGCSQSSRFTFTSDLVANTAGTATYHWERSDGARTSDRTAVFAAAGTQRVTNTWDLSSDATPGTYEVYGWQKMVVTSPIETSSKASDASFTLYITC